MRWFWIACLMAGAAWGQDGMPFHTTAELYSPHAIEVGDCFQLTPVRTLEKIDCPAKATVAIDPHKDDAFLELLKNAKPGEITGVTHGDGPIDVERTYLDEHAGSLATLNQTRCFDSDGHRISCGKFDLDFAASKPREIPATKKTPKIPWERYTSNGSGCRAPSNGDTSCLVCLSGESYNVCPAYSCPSQGTWVMETDTKGGAWCRSIKEAR